MNIAQFLGNNMAGGIVNKENDPSLLFFSLSHLTDTTNLQKQPFSSTPSCYASMSLADYQE